MPEFRIAGSLDGVPVELRPGDGRVGAALAAVPVPANGEVRRLDDTLTTIYERLERPIPYDMGTLDQAPSINDIDLGTL